MSRHRPSFARNAMYGNVNGLPGLPKSNFVRHSGPRGPRPAQPPPQQPQPLQPPLHQPPPTLLATPGPDPALARKMDILEQRLNAAEQSNRALMDDLMRLQQDIKVTVKKNELGLAEERDARNRIDMTVREVQNRTYDTDERLRLCEEGNKENRSAMQQLSGHLRSIEKTVSSSHQEQMDRRNNSAQRLQEYKHEMMKMNQDKDALERLCYSLRDEVRDTSNKVETMSQDITALDSNMRVQARLMDENTRRPYNLKNQASNKTVSDISSGERLALEGKIIKLNTTVQDIAARVSVESRKREKIEHDLNVRVNDLLQELGNTKVEKDKELRDFDDKMKVLQSGFSVSEKQRIQMEISSVANDLSRKMDEKETKLRADTVNKLSVIESTLNKENKRRSQKEKELDNNFDKHMKELKVYHEEGNKAMKKILDKHMEQTRARVGEVTSGLNSVEASLGEFRLMHDKVMTAEITERQNSEKILDAKIEDLEDRMRCGMAALQSAVGDVGNVQNAQGTVPASRKSSRDETQNLDDLFKVQAENEEGIREQVAKDMSRIESRIAEVETKVKHQDEQLENKLLKSRGEDQEASSIMGDKMQQKIDSVIFSQERLKKQVDELENRVEDAPKNVSQLKEDVEGIEGRLGKRIEQERKERSQDITEVRGDIERIIGANERAAASVPSLARLSQDVDETQTGMRKLAEAIHVVKSSLGNKLKDEKKIREQETKTLTRDLGLLDGKYKDLKERIKAGGKK